MEHFFGINFLENIPGFDPLTNPCRFGSDFVGYVDNFRTVHELPQRAVHVPPNRTCNLNKRMLEFLKNQKTSMVADPMDSMHRHMINERIRREHLKQRYNALHSILPHGTKNNTRSIIEAATKEVEELQRLKVELERRHEELHHVRKMKINIVRPSSGINSMLAVLECLKQTGSKPTTIRSEFFGDKFLAVLEVQTQTEAAKVQAAIQKALTDVEMRQGQV